MENMLSFKQALEMLDIAQNRYLIMVGAGYPAWLLAARVSPHRQIFFTTSGAMRLRPIFL